MDAGDMHGVAVPDRAGSKTAPGPVSGYEFLLCFRSDQGGDEGKEGDRRGEPETEKVSQNRHDRPQTDSFQRGRCGDCGGRAVHQNGEAGMQGGCL